VLLSLTLVLLSLETVVSGSARQIGPRLVQQSSRVTRGVHVTMALFFCFACEIFFVCFVVETTFIAGDLGHEFA
jgi:hypothetical protein